MAELIESLLERLARTTILTGTGVAAIQTNGSHYTVILENGHSSTAGALILATPAFITAQLVANLDPVLAQAHAAIPYASSATVSLAYRATDLLRPLDGYGYVIPRVEDTDVVACTWTSSKWIGRAPAGYALLRLYLGRYGRRDVLEDGDEALVDLARAELRQTMGITAQPYCQRIYRWPRGMPQYTLGHLDRLAQIETRLQEQPGLFLAGAAYRGVGIPDCIHSGEAAAQAAVNYLRPDLLA
jgi:oxygen-dependent protoporphyrinogen oxidase